MSEPTLFLVATPIGNLSDFSPHAQDILSRVSFILCEDTRHTLKLLQHFGIKNRLESLHVHNEKEKTLYFIDKLIQSQTQSAALVSDAGTPAICDPGSHLVTAAHQSHVKIVLVPGPSSMTCALAASGFIQPRTLFSGFLAKNKVEQFAEFKVWCSASPCIAVCFESPRRVLETLTNMVEFFTQKFNQLECEKIEICISREISKKFEEHRRMSLIAAVEYYQSVDEIQGEFVVCVNLNKIELLQQTVTTEFAAQEAVLMSKLYKLPLKACCKELSQKYHLQAKEIYFLAHQIE